MTAVLGRLDGPGRLLFENNFAAQYHVLHGLLGWYEAVLSSGWRFSRVTQSRGAELDAAFDSLEEARDGQALAPRPVGTLVPRRSEDESARGRSLDAGGRADGAP